MWKYIEPLFNFSNKVNKAIIIFLVSCLPFIFSLNGDFVFDDSEAILNNKDVSSASWIDVFSHDFWGHNILSDTSHKSYRPFTVLTFRLNYFLSGSSFSALQFKIFNLICHIVCCFVIWQTFDALVKDLGIKKGRKLTDDVAYLATLMFAVHPVHTEAVSGIVGRADVLAAITFSLAILFYRKAMVRELLTHFIYVQFAILMAAASMLFKENGVTILGFLVIYELIMKFRIYVAHKTKGFHIHLNTSSKLRISYLLVAALLLLLLRWSVMGWTKPKFQAIDNPAAFSDDSFTRMATVNYIYFLNLLLLIWPQWLCYDWSMGCVPLLKKVGDYRIVYVWTMYLYGLYVLKIIFTGDSEKCTRRLMLISISLAVLPFIPATNLLYPVGFVVAERVLYIPSAGYCLFVAIGVRKLMRWEFKFNKQNRITTTLFCFLIVIFGLRTLHRAEQWRNEYNLFISGAPVCSLNAKIHYNIAKIFDATTNKKHKWAVTEYKEAIRLYPEYYQAMNNLANLLKKHKRYADAENYFRTALQIKRDFPAAWMNLGIVLATTGRYLDAEAAYQTALQYRKHYADCFYNMGNLYHDMKKTDMALEYWLRAIKENSTYTQAWTNLLTLLSDAGDFKRAEQLIPTALKRVPDSAAVNYAIANLYGKMDLFSISEKFFLRAIELFDKNVEAKHYGNLGVLYHRWNKYEKAEDAYQKSLSLNPLYEVTVANYAKLKMSRQEAKQKTS